MNDWREGRGAEDEVEDAGNLMDKNWVGWLFRYVSSTALIIKEDCKKCLVQPSSQQDLSIMDVCGSTKRTLNGFKG